MPLDRLNKSLIALLSDGSFHSGTQLAESLGISRTAVWKHMRGLAELNLEVVSLPGRGYRLKSPVELLSAQQIQQGLKPEAARLLHALDIHDDLDSTNTHLLVGADGNQNPGVVCLAEYQRAGRGRMGRTWVSPFGANIYLSVRWCFDSPERIAGLSLAAGVGVVRALQSAGLTGVALKWPNDIVCGNAKLGGILVEVSGEAHGQCTVVMGLGLNRYLPEQVATAIDQPWTDLYTLSAGKAPSRNGMIARILNEWLPMLDSYPEQGLAYYLDEWRNLHAYAGHPAVVRFGETELNGQIVDVTDEGLLLFRETSGHQRQLASGELQLRLKHHE